VVWLRVWGVFPSPREGVDVGGVVGEWWCGPIGIVDIHGQEEGNAHVELYGNDG
jgi:hypothetical protein